MTIRDLLLASLLVAAGALVPAACDGAIDRAADCARICQRYASCTGAARDVDTCARRCAENASISTELGRQADFCAACVDARACPGGAFGCSLECATLVP